MRIPHFRREDLDADQQTLYDHIAGGERARQGAVVPVLDSEGRLEGPFNALLLHPPIGTAVQELGRVLRFEGVLSSRCREIVILTVAAKERSAYEWDAHTRLAALAGLDEVEIHALLTTRFEAFDQPTEQAVLHLCTALLDGREVDDPFFEALQLSVGAAGMLEVTVLVGYYRLLAQQLALFAVPAPKVEWDL